MAYDGERAMFEAYRRNEYTSTGVIQWMLNNAWPSTIWHLYDYYLQPAGGFSARVRRMSPCIFCSLMTTGASWLSTAARRPFRIGSQCELSDFDLQNGSSPEEVKLDPPGDSSQRLFTIPESRDETAYHS